ncbi:uncharacterized protein MELLADRAFT_66509 [Melampsora larici-populina 98AG31]|uniref:CCHC-type domain-containing protein n=1 Tax=Melampsora larici-populina (strain 98AG31 / pathotype 3-4-7) TaxID=747676 RepID=F4RZH9_MELLP|nr:uncharacterized protein MELLADRAFT_66509 [Melampsora larici-populina 98AG31]EGG02252.1 hypothetical protein MELLADRAFT_66509 [Melampsora larici-populina 98AG31]
MKRAGFVWNEDSVMGMIFQTGVPTDYTNINITLNARLRTNPATTISAKEVEEAIRAEKHNKPDDLLVNQLTLNDTDQHSPLNINAVSRQQRLPTPRFLPPPQNVQRPTNQPSYRQRTGPNYRPPAPQNREPRAYSNNNMTTTMPRITNAPPGTQINYHPGPKLTPYNQCLACGNTGHWVRGCPLYRGGSGSSRNQGLRMNLVNANDNEFVAEPDGTYPSDAEPTGVDEQPDGIWASESHLTKEWDNPDEGVSDTGATHMITGDLSRLTDVHILSRPIPISVATKSNRAFVTAKGTLHICADDGSSIPIKNTYYSPAAQRTLISIPEIVESGGSWMGGNGESYMSDKTGHLSKCASS